MVVVALAILVRVFIALATQTFFQPDEYFQSLEVAHRLVYGYGHLTWEWLSPKPIRSILYPALNIPIYWVLKVLALDETILLIWGPKILHGVLAAMTDIWICKLTRRVVGERYAYMAYLFSLTSFFHGVSLSRSMSNSLETSLTTVALSYFPWDTDRPSWQNGFRKCLCVAALACALRPTNAVLWVYLGATLLWQLRSRGSDIASVILDALLVGVISVLLLCGLDSLYYGTPTLTPLNFALTNLSAISLFYGSSPWHYYLTQAVPILCTTALPFVLHGAWLSMGPAGTPAARKMLGLIAWTVGIYSAAGHKEWRFIHPLLPLLHILAAKSFVDLYYTQAESRRVGKRWYRLPVTRACGVLMLLNLPPLLYLMRVHERAQIDALYYLRSLPPGEVKSVGFLMPCHSTPWQAYLHRSTMADSSRYWALGCEPPLRGERIGEYKDQTDVFYESPITYLRERFPARVDPAFPPSPNPFSEPGRGTSGHPWRHEWPEYLVMFGALAEDGAVKEFLAGLEYRTVWHEEHGWEGDTRRRGGVSVMIVAPESIDGD